MILVAEDRDFEALAKGDLVRGRPVADGGIAPLTVMDMLRGLAARVRPVCDPAAWWMIENDEIVGLCSIVAVPTQAAVIDIGYGVAESRKGQGRRRARSAKSWPGPERIWALGLSQPRLR